jgi:hypothetical protein
MVVILWTRARIRIVKRKLERKPPEASAPAVLCGLKCPGDVELAAYLDDRLDLVAQQKLHEHLLYCPRCYSLCQETASFLEGENG